ncbi:hypothetical protein HerbRD11066_21900 [Herbidospora sp. RD11066]
MPHRTWFLTIGHDQADATVHAYPGGETLLQLPAEDETLFEWSGGFLTADTLIVVLAREDESICAPAGSGRRSTAVTGTPTTSTLSVTAPGSPPMGGVTPWLRVRTC